MNKPKYVAQLPKTLEAFDKFLGERKWFAGENLTYVDFFAWETIDQHELFLPGCLDKFKNLKSYHERFQALPKIAEYMKSPRYIKRPINQPFAAFH